MALFLSVSSSAIQVIGEPAFSSLSELDSELPIGACTEVRLGSGKELAIYKDFTLLGMIEIDPRGDRISERPLLGSFGGVLFMNRLGPAHRLKTLSLLAQLVRRDNKSGAGPESLFAPVMLCGENPYQGSLGYFEIDALRLARVDSYSNQLPPSTSPNKIPQLKLDVN